MHGKESVPFALARPLEIPSVLFIMVRMTQNLPPPQKKSPVLSSKISRRTIVAGTAWSLPVIYTTSPVPAYAASIEEEPQQLEGNANVV